MEPLSFYAVVFITTAVVCAMTFDPSEAVTLLAVAGVVGIAFAIFRSGAFGVLTQANAELRRGRRESDAKIHSLEEQVAELMATRDLEPIAASIVEQFALHEERASERHESLMPILAGIAANLERLNRRNP